MASLGTPLPVKDADLDRPVTLFDPPTLVQNSLDRLGVKTVRDLLAVPPARLLELRGIGWAKVQDIWELVGRVLGVVLDEGDGSALLPHAATADELAERALSAIDEPGRTYLRERFLHQKSLHRIAAERATHVNGAMLGVRKAVERLRPGFCEDARRLTGPLASAMRRAGGFIHSVDAHRLVSAKDLGTLELALVLAEDDRYTVWRDEFLTLYTRSELKLRFEQLQKSVKGAATMDALRAAARRHKLRLPDKALRRLVELAAGVVVAGTDSAGLAPATQSVERLLELAGRPMHTLDIARAYARRVSGQGKEIGGGTANLYKRLSELRSVYCCAPGMYVHVKHLPIPLKRLEAAVEWCARRLDELPDHVSAEWLLEELGSSGLDIKGINASMLRSAVARHPDVVTGRGSLLARVRGREQVVPLASRVEEVLLKASRPLTPTEIHELLPAVAKGKVASIAATVGKNPWAVGIDGRYAHVDTLGLDASTLNELVESALGALPKDGLPVSSGALLRVIGRARPHLLPPEGRAFAPSDLLWALLRADGRARCGTNGLVSADRSLSGRSLLVHLAIHVIAGSKRPLQPAAVRAALRKEHACEIAESALYHTLSVLTGRGVLTHSGRGYVLDRRQRLDDA